MAKIILMYFPLNLIFFHSHVKVYNMLCLTCSIVLFYIKLNKPYLCTYKKIIMNFGFCSNLGCSELVDVNKVDWISCIFSCLKQFVKSRYAVLHTIYWWWKNTIQLVKTNIMDDVTVEMKPCWDSQTNSLPSHRDKLLWWTSTRLSSSLMCHNTKKNICKASY